MTALRSGAVVDTTRLQRKRACRKHLEKDLEQEKKCGRQTRKRACREHLEKGSGARKEMWTANSQEGIPGTPGKGIWSKKRNVDGKLQVQVEKGGDGSTRKSWMGDKKWPVEYDLWEQQGMSQESIYKNRTVCLSDRLRVGMLNGRNANHVTLPAICEARLWLVIINRWSLVSLFQYPQITGTSWRKLWMCWQGNAVHCDVG